MTTSSRRGSRSSATSSPVRARRTCTAVTASTHSPRRQRQRDVPAHEPSLRFWLSYAESAGALVEDAGDHALVLLPQPLRATAGLPEEVTVTSDPDVAREDGAVLLIAGHPAL